MGAGVNPDNLHAERVDGYNPLAVAAAVAAKRDLLLAGRGPALLDTVTYRVAGHSSRDPATYRTREEIEAWEERDSLRSYGEYLGEAGLLDAAERERIESWAVDVIERAFRRAAPLDTSPRFGGGAQEIEAVMFSARPTEAMASGEPELTMPVAENPRVKALSGRSRSAFGADGKRLPISRVITMRDALFEALLHRFATDPTMIAYGEENPRLGRRLRRLPRPHRVPALPPAVQLAHLGGFHRRQRHRLRHERRPRGGGADVLRLSGPRR